MKYCTSNCGSCSSWLSVKSVVNFQYDPKFLLHQEFVNPNLACLTFINTHTCKVWVSSSKPRADVKWYLNSSLDPAVEEFIDRLHFLRLKLACWPPWIAHLVVRKHFKSKTLEAPFFLSFFKVLLRRNSSNWILKMTSSVTVWPWCQLPCQSLVMWRETQHMATRSCVIPGSQQAKDIFTKFAMIIPKFSTLKWWLWNQSSNLLHFTILNLKCVIIVFVHRRPMPSGRYVVHVSVDGVPIPDSKICRGYTTSYHCSFFVSKTSFILQAPEFGDLLYRFPKVFPLSSFLRRSGIAHLLSTPWSQSVVSQVQFLPINHTVHCARLPEFCLILFIIHTSQTQTLRWPWEDGSSLMCMEATLPRAPMASMSDFWGTRNTRNTNKVLIFNHFVPWICD